MRKGSHMSEEAKRKISAWGKVNNPMRGRRATDEQRARMSAAQKASEAGRSARERLADSRRGKPRKPFTDPVAHSLALSKALKGKPHNVKRRVQYGGPPAPNVLVLPEFPGCLPATGKEVERVASVYAIVNTVNGKLYIGSSVDTELRWFSHRHELMKGKHHGHALQRAWNKYGPDAFVWRLLEIVTDREVLLAREQYWIDHYRSWNGQFGYNARKIAKGAPPSHGELNGHAVLKDADIPTIRARLTAGEKRSTLANEYGVSTSAIHALALGYTWRHIPGSVPRYVRPNRPGAKRQIGSRHGNAKLNEADVKAIRQRLAAGEKQVELARAYGVAPSLICSIAARKLWIDVDP